MGTAARWLASKLAAGQEVVEETNEQVLPHVEEGPEHRVMGRDATVFDVLAAFEDPIRDDTILDAIILTQGGGVCEMPLGIVTVTDLPRLTRHIRS